MPFKGRWYYSNFYKVLWQCQEYNKKLLDVWTSSKMYLLVKKKWRPSQDDPNLVINSQDLKTVATNMPNNLKEKMDIMRKHGNNKNKPDGNFKLRSTMSKVKLFLNWIDIRLET